MENNFSKVMAERSDSELLRILNELRNDYQPAAIEAAESEFKRRNLDENQIKIAKEEKDFIDRIKSVKADAPLESGLKVVAFLFPGLLFLLFSGTLKADGFDRKAKELAKWTLLGFSLYFGIAILIIILSQLTN